MNLDEAVRNKKIVYGYKEVKKKLLKKNIGKVIFAKNCPQAIRRDIMNLCDTFNVEYEYFDGTNMELGTFCGRPHSISVLGILKE